MKIIYLFFFKQSKNNLLVQTSLIHLSKIKSVSGVTQTNKLIF